jgi:hypothetical protein
LTFFRTERFKTALEYILDPFIKNTELAQVTNEFTPKETKECPYCAETIKKAAKVCRFCRIDLESGDPISQGEIKSVRVKTTKTSWFGLFLIIACIAVFLYGLLT